jgi:putative acetyltransferase
MESHPLADTETRIETEHNFDPIDDVVVAAFQGRSEFSRFVRAIRNSPDYVPGFSLVAKRAKRVIGHVMLSYVRLLDGDAAHSVLTLSPLAVAPEMQGQGVRSSLAIDVLTRADRSGEPLVLLKGRPAHYPRFGFVPASTHDITLTLPEWAPPEAAMVKLLSNHDPSLKGPCSILPRLIW